MAQPRCNQVDLDSTLHYHCVSRCVRRAFLCGDDRHTGKNFDHRKTWVVERLRFLSAIFAVDVCAYAVMSNHFHLVLRVDPARALAWDEDEVAERYGKLFKHAKGALEDLDDERRAQMVALWRARLSDLSWMMRSLNEWIARRANKEDECKGRFWEGRFKSQPLIGETALLTCMTYVDLNPVRAGVCERLDDAEFTSIEARLRDSSERMDETVDADHRVDADDRSDSMEPLAPSGLMPFSDQTCDDDTPCVPMDFLHYVELLEWTGRAVREDGGPSGSLKGSPPALITRLGLEPKAWLSTMSRHGLRSIGVLGTAEDLQALAARQGKRWVKGAGWAKKAFASAA